jgi:hypothetical protein
MPVWRASLRPPVRAAAYRQGRKCDTFAVPRRQVSLFILYGTSGSQVQIQPLDLTAAALLGARGLPVGTECAARVIGGRSSTTTGHDVMIDQPAWLADLLLKAS